MKYYDACDRNSILDFSKLLVGKTLRTHHGADSTRLANEIGVTSTDKGAFGTLVECVHFGLRRNNRSEPDLISANVEIKTSPIVHVKSSLSSKERLVLSMIDYSSFSSPNAWDFDSSSFWKKNRFLLILFYLWAKESKIQDYVFRFVCYWDFPAEDLKIIRDDWNKIIAKIRNGDAHNLSGGDTLYLEACTKGGTFRQQPFNQDEKAKSRAFALKSRYLNSIIVNQLGLEDEVIEPVVKSLSDYGANESFEDLVVSKFRKYYGMSEKEIATSLGTTLSTAKHRRSILAKQILGITAKKVAEFEKADVEMKTVLLKVRGAPDQHMSFGQIDYTGILDENWEESYWFETITKRFLFIIFQIDGDGEIRLTKAFFWTMPPDDIKLAEEFWIDTRDQIRKNDFKHFWKISDDRVFHVRPKGKNRQGEDLADTPAGGLEEKNCYWLNKNYIQKVIATADDSPD